MLSRVTAKNVGDVFLRHCIYLLSVLLREEVALWFGADPGSAAHLPGVPCFLGPGIYMFTAPLTLLSDTSELRWLSGGKRGDFQICSMLFVHSYKHT